VAGTIGGKTYGVAKDVTLVSVRVFPCIGETPDSVIIWGLEQMILDHPAGTPAVANMSFSGPINQALDDAVQNVIDDGISVVIAAGNGTLNDWRAVDACGFSPGRVAAAMTMGATTSKDMKASFSNYGPCVDWFAPGASITSAYDWSDTAVATMNGTSMATPHTVGVAALYLQAHQEATPAAVRDALYAATTKGIVKSARSTNNHLLYSLIAAP
jgi:subtilisin family serine protease